MIKIALSDGGTMVLHQKEYDEDVRLVILDFGGNIVDSYDLDDEAMIQAMHHIVREKGLI